MTNLAAIASAWPRPAPSRLVSQPEQPQPAAVEQLSAKERRKLREQAPEYKAAKRARKAKRRALLKASRVAATRNERQQVQVYYDAANTLARILGIDVHVDHIMPIAKGGPHLAWNLRLATAQENMSKQDSMDALMDMFEVVV